MKGTRLKVSIADGNTKLGAVPAIALPPVKACGNCSKCRRTCYALKAWRQYKQTRAAWARNYTLATKYRDQYFGQIGLWLQRKEPRFFRWHVSGDILDQDYLERMKRIAAQFEHETACHGKVRFLCFTKMYHLNFSGLPSNLKIVFSAWPGLPMGEDNTWHLLLPIAYMQDDDNLDPRIPKDAKECPGNCESCGMCWHLKAGESVVFHKH